MIISNVRTETTEPFLSFFDIAAAVVAVDVVVVVDVDVAAVITLELLMMTLTALVTCQTTLLIGRMDQQSPPV